MFSLYYQIENKMKIFKFTTEQYSESVLRQALYWMTPMTEWSLTINESLAEIVLEKDGDEISYHFYQLLNDYKLREHIESKTKNTRDSIMQKVLASLDKRLSQ